MPGSAVADIQDTYGASLIGLLVSTVLYGVTVTQIWIYYCQYRDRDPMVFKGFITLLFILDTLHTILCIYSVYWYLILNFGNLANLDLNMWAVNIQPDVNGLIGFLVQLFYARRVYIMSKSIVIPAIIAVLGAITFSLGFVFTAKSFALKRYSLYGSLTWVTCVGMGSTAVADIIIALAMCWYLYGKRTGFSKTDSMIMTLMSYSITSGLLTSILATSMLICFVVRRNTLTWEVMFWLMGKCYVNSFLAMLNNRDSLRGRSSNENSSHSFNMSIRQSRTAYKYKTGATAVAVNVQQTISSDLATSKIDYDNLPELEKSGVTTTPVRDGSRESSV